MTGTSTASAVVLAAKDPTNEVLTYSISGAALVVSITSVVIGILIFRSERRTRRREATLRVWIEWQEEHRQRRSAFVRALPEPISQGQAIALVRRTDSQGLPPPESKERRQIVSGLILQLNGLERIAFGVELGLYDRRTLQALGGTIIATTVERSYEYIKERRESSMPQFRQKDAFSALLRLNESMFKGRFQETP